LNASGESLRDEASARDIAEGWEAAMRRGDFEAAWRETDRIEISRRARQAQPGFTRRADELTWNGTPFDGRDVLVRCEHGLGDTLQFIRYVPLIRRVARGMTVLVQPSLLDLLQRCPEFGDVRNGWSDVAPPSHDVGIEVMELAYAFRSTVATLPKDTPYLPSDAVRRAAPPLPPLAADGLRVGLTWAASDWDESRSVPLSVLAPLGRVPGVRFYSLQQGRHAGSYADAPFAIEPYSQHTSAVESAAAAMLDLDLVITVDSMVAHLAGALGRPVWVLLKARADWRWMDDREDTPWYPTMRLFRQPREGDWGTVTNSAAMALLELAAPR
jgi:hypothetical protein